MFEGGGFQDLKGEVKGEERGCRCTLIVWGTVPDEALARGNDLVSNEMVAYYISVVCTILSENNRCSRGGNSGLNVFDSCVSLPYSIYFSHQSLYAIYLKTKAMTQLDMGDNNIHGEQCLRLSLVKRCGSEYNGASSESSVQLQWIGGTVRKAIAKAEHSAIDLPL